MLHSKSTISWILFTVLFFTHTMISKSYDYRGMYHTKVILLLALNILLLVYANFYLLRKSMLLPGLIFWFGFTGAFFFLIDFLAVSNAGIGLRIVYWIDFILILIFLLKENANEEAPGESGSGKTAR
jgi:hypothetical protein